MEGIFPTVGFVHPGFIAVALLIFFLCQSVFPNRALMNVTQSFLKFSMKDGKSQKVGCGVGLRRRAFYVVIGLKM